VLLNVYISLPYITVARTAVVVNLCTRRYSLYIFNSFTERVFFRLANIFFGVARIMGLQALGVIGAPGGLQLQFDKPPERRVVATPLGIYRRYTERCRVYERLGASTKHPARKEDRRQRKARQREVPSKSKKSVWGPFGLVNADDLPSSPPTFPASRPCRVERLRLVFQIDSQRSAQDGVLI